MTPADIVDLSGPHFLKLVWRLPAYAGALRARIELQQQDDELPQGVDEVVDSTPTALQAAGLGDLISFGTG